MVGSAGDPEENCRILQPMEDHVQRGCKRAHGESNIVQAAASAALARARMRKKELWVKYYQKKKTEGWCSIEGGILMAG